MNKNISFVLSDVCLEGKLKLFSDISQNSMLEKWTLHKIQYQKNGLFTKFSTRKTDSSQNLIPEKQTFHKIQYTGMKVFTVF